MQDRQEAVSREYWQSLNVDKDQQMEPMSGSKAKRMDLADYERKEPAVVG